MREFLSNRREMLIGVGALTLLGSGIGRAMSAPPPMPTVSEAALTDILTAGNWSTSADDNGGNERISEAAARSLVKAAAGPSPSRQSVIDLGVLGLTLAVAEWGVEWEGAQPADPAAKRWTGPKSIEAGKHLMSYALGGIGLPHLDAQDGIAFFRHLSSLLPGEAKLANYVQQLPTDFHYDRIRAAGGMCDGHHAVIATDIFGEVFHHDDVNFAGSKYCSRFNSQHRLDPEQWQVFRSWARLGLRRRDMQRWIVDTWIERYWLPAYDLVMRQPHGSLAEAFIIARIWNSGSGLAKAAIAAAASSSDPQQRIKIELDNYCSRSPTYLSRRPVMQRPAIVYQHLAV